MSEKLTCPGCGSHTSGVLMAAMDERPCPYCGLPAETILEVEAIRKSRADAAMVERAAAAELRAGKAEAEVLRLRRRLDRIADEVDGWRRDTPDDVGSH